MERLIKAGLFGAGLVPVDTEELVSRYNECLTALGITTTSLTRFAVDGIGWSPEVAAEKRDMYYLSAGISNPMGIVLTPNQKNKPIYFAFHSYDRALMEDYFTRYRNEIADVTTSRGISLDIDHELTSYDTPADLRLVTRAVVRSSIGTLGEAAKEQRDFIKDILDSDTAWADSALRAALITSARTHGDLRCRKLEIDDFRFSDLNTFYTRAFGGVFVVQTLDHRSRLLLLEDKQHLGKNAWKEDMFDVHNPSTLEFLAKERLLEIKLEWYQAYPRALAYLKDCLAAEIICEHEPDVLYAELTPMQRKRKLAKFENESGGVYHELERLIKQLQSTVLPQVNHLSDELRLLLVRPNRDLSLADQLVLREYLHRLRQIDIIQLYADDKNYFYELYKRWSEAKKAWAVDKLCHDYALDTDVTH